MPYPPHSPRFAGVSEIVKGIFIGSGRDGRDLLTLKQFDVVINVAKDWPVLDNAPCRYVHLPILDEPVQLLDTFLQPAFAAMDQGTNVLVHW